MAEIWDNERERIRTVTTPTARHFGWNVLDRSDLTEAGRNREIATAKKMDEADAKKKAAREAKKKKQENKDAPVSVVASGVADGDPPAAGEDPVLLPPKRVTNWAHCRDLFLREQNHLNSFYFCHNLPVGRGRSIAVFISKVEDRLGLANKNRAQFKATTRRNVIRVVPGSFWSSELMRRSLFSALLRCALNYRIHNDNFEAALYSEPYTRETRNGVRAFLNGYTHYTGPNTFGWQAAVPDNAYSRESVKGVLKKPVVTYKSKG